MFGFMKVEHDPVKNQWKFILISPQLNHLQLQGSLKMSYSPKFILRFNYFRN